MDNLLGLHCMVFATVLVMEAVNFIKPYNGNVRIFLKRFNNRKASDYTAVYPS